MNKHVEYFVVGTGTETSVKFINVDKMPLNSFHGFIKILANEKNKTYF